MNKIKAIPECGVNTFLVQEISLSKMCEDSPQAVVKGLCGISTELDFTVPSREFLFYHERINSDTSGQALIED
jgi:hypothetical protein